jgi:hypothetical protein
MAYADVANVKAKAVAIHLIMVFLQRLTFDYCGGSGGGAAGVLSRGVVSPAVAPSP